MQKRLNQLEQLVLDQESTIHNLRRFEGEASFHKKEADEERSRCQTVRERLKNELERIDKEHEQNIKKLREKCAVEVNAIAEENRALNAKIAAHRDELKAAFDFKEVNINGFQKEIETLREETQRCRSESERKDKEVKEALEQKDKEIARLGQRLKEGEASLETLLAEYTNANRLCRKIAEVVDKEVTQNAVVCEFGISAANEV